MGDSGGPLFNLDGKVIGLAGASLATWSAEHAAVWLGVPAVFNRDILLGVPDTDEARKLNLIGKDRRKFDRNRGIPTTPFADVVAPVRKSVVQVLVDGKPACLGTVVRADGLVLSKRACLLTRAGEPAGSLTCRTSTGEVLPAHAVADSHEHDVVLLQINRQSLIPVSWSEAEVPPQAAIIAALQFGDDAPFVGVVSTDRAFAVTPAARNIGFDVEAAGNGVRVKELRDEAAGITFPMKEQSYAWPSIQPGDVITHVFNKRVTDREGYLRSLDQESLVAGDLVSVTALRDGKEQQIVFPSADDLGRAFEGYQLSHRRTGYPAVIGHDAAILPEHCGGPLVDPQGQVVGINIARYQNYLTLALSAGVARKLIAQMTAAFENR
jgi:hypothetical protein